jgi:flagellar basal-body rod protein FlgF
MQNAIALALSRVVGVERLIDITANNIANSATDGYKAERIAFSDWVSRQTGTAAPRGGETIIYTQDRALWRDPREGAFVKTDNPLDLAIHGPGYFTVNTPAGPRLTRAGHFQLDAQGTLVDAEGNPLLDTNGRPITLSPSDAPIQVARDGTISGANGPIGQIGLVAPVDPTALAAEGATHLRATGPTQPVSGASIVQGMIEQSNVQPIAELTLMIDQSREYQFATQFIEEEDTRQLNAISKILTPA